MLIIIFCFCHLYSHGIVFPSGFLPITLLRLFPLFTIIRGTSFFSSMSRHISSFSRCFYQQPSEEVVAIQDTNQTINNFLIAPFFSSREIPFTLRPARAKREAIYKETGG